VSRWEPPEDADLRLDEGGESVARAFYVGVLGLPERTKPPHLAARGGCWFEGTDVKIHLGVDPDFRPALKAHPALVVSDLQSLVAALPAAGFGVIDGEPLEGYDRVYTVDPFGNRLELLEPARH
jgi:catechol 2,3-dioxygenase-like lactoylglutathione lyase family enzyme